MKKYWSSLAVLLLSSILAGGCSMEDGIDGNHCESNTDGLIADDYYSARTIDKKSADKIKKDKVCTKANPYCGGNFCSKCSGKSVNVQVEIDNNVYSKCLECGSDELESCQTESCKDARYRCKCFSDGQLKCGLDASCKDYFDECREEIVPDDETCTTDKCHDGMLSKCVEGKYQEAVGCERGLSCADWTRCRDCVNGDILCNNDKIKYCKNGVWSEETSCGDGLKCKDEVSCEVCESGETSCTNGLLKTCVNGLWGEEVRCSDGLGCFDDKQCEKCKEDSIVCADNNHYKKCENQKVTDVECTEELGGKFCVMNEAKATCKQSCGEVDSTVCTEEEGIGFVSICDGIDWGDKRRCTDDVSCQSDGVKCGSCKNGDIVCEDNKNKRCLNAQWEVTECEFGCNSAKNECKDCDDTQSVISCVNNEQGFGVQILCTSGYKSEKACLNVSCKGYDCGQCINGSEKCDVDPLLKAEYHAYRCQDGVWQDIEKCIEGCEGVSCKTSCDFIEQDGLCYKKCPGENAVLCSSSDVSCKEVAGKRACGECKNGDTKCVNNKDGVGVVQTCVAGQWSEGLLCKDSVSCKNKTNCGVCRNGFAECNTTLAARTCVNGMWNETKCLYGCHPDLAVCKECDEKTFKPKCTSIKKNQGELETCVNGFKQLMQCTDARNNPTSCYGDSKCGDCIAGSGQEECRNQELYFCSDGLMFKAPYCDKGCYQDSCNTNCKEGQKMCGGTYQGGFKTCEHDAWKSWACLAGTSCDTISNECK